MPPSQLRRLKASLREQGVIGPQKSRKQAKKNQSNGTDKKISRGDALTEIREQFNPFEFRATSRNPKFEVTSSQATQGKMSRPGLIKSQEEKMRREAYVAEKQRRKKVGGIVDKRFGESDPTMAPEEKMLERFTREKLTRHQKSSVFDLEDNDLSNGLTHMGKSLSLDGPTIMDDFTEGDLQLSENENNSTEKDWPLLKRDRLDDPDDNEDPLPERKKSKQEVMKEVIAKSKLYKYERQAAKEDDEDLREELDKEVDDIHNILRGIPTKISNPTSVDVNINPQRAALIAGNDKARLEKDYDLRLKQLALDKRSQPTEKSKTEDEIAKEQARKLHDLENNRLQRMQGSISNHDAEIENLDASNGANDISEDYGFGTGIKVRQLDRELGVEDEDDFLIEDDLVASFSEMEDSEVNSSDLEGELSDDDNNNDQSEGSFPGEPAEASQRESAQVSGKDLSVEENPPIITNDDNTDLAFQYVCPKSHEEFLEVLKNVNIIDLPTVVQRIRILYHPKLRSENKAKLGKFSDVLVEHLIYLANQKQNPPPFATVESLIRHIHSLAKTFPVEISNSFRHHLRELGSLRALAPTPGDLVLLTAIGTIFPTSDHFHQVVTPAILSIARYLGLKVPKSLGDFAIGSYLCTICIQYQMLSKRFVPEVMNFIQNTLCTLAPSRIDKASGISPYHKPQFSLRLKENLRSTKSLNFYDCFSDLKSHEEKEAMKLSLIEVNLKLLDAAADIWYEKEAFIEVFLPALEIVQQISDYQCHLIFPETTQNLIKKLHQKLETLTNKAKLQRRPLELHHHRPLAIKTSLPKFEENFNPERHYDPDKTRTEMAKLKKEHKREKKGAIRELRKDAKILAHESLREKKEKDAAYEKKYKRLIAEIQGEEGKEANAYEREKQWRRKGKK
ncbi:BgTH12-05717 [Blumeria graminis f. sp. triticale]|uniref:BgTH12-05717 n=1 Tax=Blumeria graminis f. sp. triticale TaxID=1689686 RepID=A0A9W4GGH7_BLUGR|nr:BgTH12-05717 [Blumeria graminis f. sp. triticale]